MDKKASVLHTYNAVANAYQDKFMDLDIYNDTYDAFCKLIEKPHARIFEIGCGPGNITRYLLTQRPDFELLGIDLAPNMIQLAKANNPGARFEVMDCREISTLNTPFDGIMCGFCMPYLSREECAQLIQDSAALLQAGGIFYFSVIEDDYENSRFETSSNGQFTLFVYCHQADYLSEMLKPDFEMLEWTRILYPKADGSIQTHLIGIARRRQPPSC